MNITDPDKAFVEGLTKLSEKHPTLRFDVDWQTGIAILASLQVALRHPGNTGETARIVRKFCDALIAKIETVHPAFAEVLRWGHDPTRDVTREGK